MSMRICEGGGDNRYCYHRVATLADGRERSRRRRYAPLALAPAALLASFGLGCEPKSSIPPNHQPTPTATIEPTAPPKSGPTTAPTTHPDPPNVTEYAVVEPPGIDEYGIPEPDIVDEYGLP